MVQRELTDTLSSALDAALDSRNLLSEVVEGVSRPDFVDSLFVGGVFLFMLLVLLVLNSYLGNFFKLYLSSIFFTKDLHKIREKDVNCLFLEALMVFMSFVLSYRLMNNFQIHDYDFLGLLQWQTFVLIPTVIFVLFWLKFFILKLLDHLLKQKGQFSIIQVASLNFYILIVSIMTIYDFVRIAWNQSLMTVIYPYLGGFLFLIYILYLYKLINSLRLRKSVMILYLCTLEILPVFVVIKLFLKYI